MQSLAKRYIQNAIYYENELIMELVQDSIKERKKSLLDMNLVDNIILFERDVIEHNELNLTRQFKHRTLLCDFLIEYIGKTNRS